MGIFSKLKKALNPGGAVVSAFAGNGKNYIGPADYLMDKDKAPKAPPQAPFDPGQRTGASINGQSGVAQPSMRLGWTNGGYNYANSPFNGQPVSPANPMSFAPPQNAGAGMGGPPRMQLPTPPVGGSMQAAGAQAPQGPPTAPNPQMIQAQMLRNRGGNMM